MSVSHPVAAVGGLPVEAAASEPWLNARSRFGQAIVRQGVIGYVVALAVSVGLVVSWFALPAAWSAGVIGLVGMWLTYSFAALPAFERARSVKPSSRFMGLLGAVSFAVVLTGAETSATARHAAIATLAAPLALTLSALVHRMMLRRAPTILVGQIDTVRRLNARWAGRSDINVVETCSWRSPHELAPAGSVADGGLADVVREVLAAVAERHAAIVVIASGRAFTHPALRHLVWALQRADVECVVVTDMNDHVEYLSPRRVGGQTALSLRATNDHLVSVLAKSVFDRVSAALGLLLLSPLLLTVAVMIRLCSHGPAIFCQERMGRDGRRFTMYKFRTMVPDAERQLDGLRSRDEGAGPMFKLRDDPRITRLGRVLRRTSIDELPQLINVVKGEMSLVGPRPALPAETAQYNEWMSRRLHVLPGLTGLWQVSGRSALSWEDSVRVDLQYVNTWNLRLDAVILLRTVRAVLARDGAH